MKVFWACLLISVAVWAHSQTVPEPAEAAQSPLSVADFGLVYPLSNDWVRATEMLRRRVQSSSDAAPNFDVLLAAVYVPKSNMSESSPFFSLRAYRQPATDCKKSLEAMIAHSQDKKDRPEGGIEEFSAAGRDYFRVTLAHGIGGRHQSVICTTAKGHLLVWNAGAPNQKGLDVIVATLNSITPSPQTGATGSAQSTEPKERAAEGASTKPDAAGPERVKVSRGVTTGLLIKKANPIYPADARAAYIQGTVVLQAEISKTGDITDLELVEGPIELAGSAVAAVRQWKYKPYLLMGQPVAVDTQIQVNYQLRP
ncbi:MAG TPA: energy transducer TonB [Candidatus Deferrimicrobiaceae bacterium]|nr:energy transducer TonB [Candidatus Deferrimicrobiaceae bacterium]